jgi:hypothetical protein
MKTFLVKILGSWQLVLIIFFFIFSASAVGVYNTMDAPQLYTGESLIRYRSLDLSQFKEPHNYTFPDVYYHNKQILGLRGYLFSALSIPIHLISRLFIDIVDVSGFTPDIATAEGFKLELIITTFLTIYAALGLGIWYLITSLVTKQKLISWLAVFTIGFGSYIWKYSSAYIRQNMIILLLGLAGWCLLMALRTKKYGWIIGLLIIWSLSFGIDIILFIALSISFITIFLYQRVNIFNKTWNFKPVNIWLAVPLIILILNIFFNFHWYDSLLASQTNQQPTVKELLGDKATKAWLSTPIFPTLRVVLFNFGKIDIKAFRNFDALPEEVATFTSAEYAKKYNFFGIFSITPVLFFCILGLYSKNINRIFKLFLISIFCLGVLGNLKVLNFWAGNQYDVRYFYPYIVVLIPLVAEGFLVIKRIKIGLWRYFGFITFCLASMWSIIMGWIGELNMYLPSMSGERKIWNDIFSFGQIINFGPESLFSLTFMNWNNWWWPTLTTLTILIIISLITSFWRKLKPGDGHKQKMPLRRCRREDKPQDNYM